MDKIRDLTLDPMNANRGTERGPADDPGADLDAANELQEKWKTETGQVWQHGWFGIRSSAQGQQWLPPSSCGANVTSWKSTPIIAR